MKAKGKKSNDEKGPHPYDFTLKKDTAHTLSDARPLKPNAMAEGMAKTHGIKKALEIVEPMTITSFKDNNGQPVAVNESAAYWKNVFQILKKGA